MNRKIKNVVMIITIIIVCVLSCFIMNAAVKSNIPNNSRFENEFKESMPQFNNEEVLKENIPQKPSGDFENREMPSNKEFPNDFKNGEMPNLDEMPENFKNGNFSKEQFKVSISSIYYILFAAEGLIISLLLIYLIMSRFNSKTLKETFGTGAQKIVFIILVLIITIGLTILQSMLSKNVFSINQDNNMPQFENRQSLKNDTNNTNIINKNDTDKI